MLYKHIDDRIKGKKEKKEALNQGSWVGLFEQSSYLSEVLIVKITWVLIGVWALQRDWALNQV